MAFRIETLAVFGILLIVIGCILVFFGTLMGTKQTESKTKIAFGGFIGPIPFGFGNEKDMLWFATILTLALFLMWLFFSHRLIK